MKRNRCVRLRCSPDSLVRVAESQNRWFISMKAIYQEAFIFIYSGHLSLPCALLQYSYYPWSFLPVKAISDPFFIVKKLPIFWLLYWWCIMWYGCFILCRITLSTISCDNPSGNKKRPEIFQAFSFIAIFFLILFRLAFVPVLPGILPSQALRCFPVNRLCGCTSSHLRHC